MSLTTPAALYIWSAVLVVLALYLYYDHRNGRRFARNRRKSAYHCVKCDHLYAANRDDALHPCPRCGHPNGRLKY